MDNKKDVGTVGVSYWVNDTTWEMRVEVEEI